MQFLPAAEAAPAGWDACDRPGLQLRRSHILSQTPGPRNLPSHNAIQSRCSLVFQEGSPLSHHFDTVTYLRQQDKTSVEHRSAKPKRQYLLTCKVSRYCLLTLHGKTGPRTCLSKQTRDIDPMLDQCWSTLDQHWSSNGSMSRVCRVLVSCTYCHPVVVFAGHTILRQWS